MIRITLKKPFSFQWDRGNELKNWIKHNVSAIEAEDIFYDNKRLLLEDSKHSSKDEKRFILVGKTQKRRMLVIAFTIREEKIRIISARDTNRKEEIIYEKAINNA